MKFSISNESLMLVVDGNAHTVSKSQPNFQPLCDALLAGRFNDVPKHLTMAAQIEDWSDGEFAVVNGQVTYQGDVLPSVFSERILKMVRNGENPDGLMMGWERLEENPSWRSREQLFDFLKRHPGIPFTDDGYLLFYKGVKKNFRDCHTGKFDNSPGKHLKMKRNRVSDDPTKPCHFGFHVGSRKFAASFGDEQTVICKVNPRDVVCVPNDQSQQKVRICEYWVIGVDKGSLLPDTTISEKFVEPPIDPKEPLVADPAMQSGIDEIDGMDPEHDGAPPTHTDGSPLEKGETAPLPVDAPAAVTLPLTGTVWDYMNDMDSLALLDEGIDPLRRYARNNCLIVGASKRTDGKTGLIGAIIQARGYNDPQEGKSLSGEDGE